MGSHSRLLVSGCRNVYTAIKSSHINFPIFGERIFSPLNKHLDAITIRWRFALIVKQTWLRNLSGDTNRHTSIFGVFDNFPIQECLGCGCCWRNNLRHRRRNPWVDHDRSVRIDFLGFLEHEAMRASKCLFFKYIRTANTFDWYINQTRKSKDWNSQLKQSPGAAGSDWRRRHFQPFLHIWRTLSSASIEQIIPLNGPITGSTDLLIRCCHFYLRQFKRLIAKTIFRSDFAFDCWPQLTCFLSAALYP